MPYRCNLIVDSCCDLPYEFIDREGVDLIEFSYFFGDEEHFDNLWKDSDPHDFYERMRKKEMPTTAQISITVLTDVFTKALKSGVPTVYLSFSSGLSGCFDNAMLVADQVKASFPEGELYLVDTHLASSGQALLVLEALRQREKGLSAKELTEWANEAQYFVNACFMVDTLDALSRGGRIPSSVAAANSKLDVKPILTIDIEGKLAMKGITRGRKKGLKQLVSFFSKRADLSGNTPCICVGNADCSKDMKRLEAMLLELQPTPFFVENNVGPVIGSHVGPGMVSIAFWGPDRRKDLSVADRIARRARSVVE